MHTRWASILWIRWRNNFGFANCCQEHEWFWAFLTKTLWKGRCKVWWRQESGARVISIILSVIAIKSLTKTLDCKWSEEVDFYQKEVPSCTSELNHGCPHWCTSVVKVQPHNCNKRLPFVKLDNLQWALGHQWICRCSLGATNRLLSSIGIVPWCQDPSVGHSNWSWRPH